MKFIIRMKGGSGSGNFGHAGVPGEVGGSAPTGSMGGADRMGTEENSPVIHSIDYSDDPNHFVDRFPEILHQFDTTNSRHELQKLKKTFLDEGKVPDGAVLYFFKKHLSRFRSTDAGRSASETRLDRILRIRNSEGKATARK